MDLTVTFQMTNRDYRGLVRNSPVIRHFAAVSLFLALVGAFTLFLDDSKEWLIFFGLGMLVYVEVIAVRAAAGKVAAQFPGPWTLHLTEETYTLRTSASQVAVNWNAFSDARERGGFWYLRTSRMAAEVIPKRALDENQHVALAAFLAGRLPPR